MSDAEGNTGENAQSTTKARATATGHHSLLTQGLDGFALKVLSSLTGRYHVSESHLGLATWPQTGPQYMVTVGLGLTLESLPPPSVHIFLTFLKKHKGTVFKKVPNTNFVFLPIFTLPFLFWNDSGSQTLLRKHKQKLFFKKDKKKKRKSKLKVQFLRVLFSFWWDMSLPLQDSGKFSGGRFVF